MNKTTYIIITLWVVIFSSAKAQKRKILIHEAATCYTDTDFTQLSMMYKNIGDSVIVTKYKDGYWAVPYDGYTIYVNEFALKDITDENAKIARRKEITDSLIKRKFLIKKYGIKMGSFISNGYIKRGMTKRQARLSWGEPNQIHRTVFSGGIHEQWVYSRSCLYFENDFLTAWQD